MSLGKKILTIRQEAQMTQKEICSRTGLATSYLSRVENDRITPSVPTLKRIAGALGIPVTAFFDQTVPLIQKEDPCPVSLSGKCILDLAHRRDRRKLEPNVETYSDQQLEILRECNYLLHTRDKEVLTALSTMMKALLSLALAEKKVRFDMATFAGEGI